MADLTTLRRIARRLALLAETTPRGDTFWPTLAEAAARELESPPTVTQAALPAEPMVAVTPSGDGYQLIARGATVADLQGPVSTYLAEKGVGARDVWIAEIRRVLVVS